MKKKYIMIFESFDPMFRYWSEIEVLTSRSEVKKLPLRGQNKKIMPYLNFLAKKNYI